MIIVAGGDSLVWGSELSDYKHCGLHGYSQSTYSALLSKNYEYYCAAYPGFGNQQILHSTKNCIDSLKNQKLGVIVSWSWPSRDNKIDSDQEILEMQNFLNKNRIPYLFTCADNCVITNNKDIDYSKWFLFPSKPYSGFYENDNPRGFFQWAVEYKYNLAPKDRHPLEDAHRDAASLMKGKFYELVEKNLLSYTS